MTSNVIDMKGNAMSNVVEPPAPPTDPTPQEVIIQAFFNAVTEMHKACQMADMRNAHFRTEDGKVYSAAAVMRLIDRHMNFIRARMGGDYTPSSEQTPPRSPYQKWRDK